MIKKFKTIERQIEAVLYDESQQSRDDILELLESDEDNDIWLTGLIRANSGEWVIKKDDGDYEVMTDEEFQLNYRQV